MRRVRDGITGWLCALLPLIVVNALGYVGLLDTVASVVAGAAALLGAPLLGGVVVGLLGGRPRRGNPGGAAGALVAGALAGALYLASLLGLVVVAARLGAEPELLAAHPIRVGLAALCFACILVAVTLGVAALAGRRAGVGVSHDRPMGASARRGPADWSAPSGGGRASPPSTAAMRSRATPPGLAARSLSQPTAAARRPTAAGSRPSLDRDARR